jgi:hypothetical protein
MRRWAIVGAVVVFVLGALFVVRPFVSVQRDMPAEIVSPASLEATASVPLDPGKPICFSHAVAEHHSEFARFQVSTPAGPAPQMTVRITSPQGYDATGVVPPGLLDGQTAQIAIPAPVADFPVQVCISNDGETPVALLASADRTQSRSTAYIDGKPVGKSVWFAFYEPRWRAITERIPATIDRMTVFRPSWVHPWLLWIIAVLFLVGIPIATVWALVRALRDDHADDLTTLDVNTPRPAWRRFLD